MGSNGKVITRTRALQWRENWGVSDRKFLEDALYGLPEGAELCDRGSRITARQDGRLLLEVFPGYVVWPGAVERPEVDGSLVTGGVERYDDHTGNGFWARLSTFKPLGGF